MSFNSFTDEKNTKKSSPKGEEDKPKKLTKYSSGPKFRGPRYSGVNFSNNIDRWVEETGRDKYISFNDNIWKWENPIPQEPTPRGIIDKTLGMLGNGSIVEGLYNLTDGDDETTFRQGFADGLKYMNPLHEDVSERNTFSDVLENLGWKDKPEGKLNVARGVTGFVGDVLLDPLTYVNPFSALGKVTKGSGLTMEAMKELKKVAKADLVAGDITDYTNGIVRKHKIDKLPNFTINDARKIVKESNPSLVGKELDDEATKFIDGYATNVYRLRNMDEGQGLSVGIGHLPFMNKVKIGERTFDTFKKELVSSKALRTLGDNTYAPFYNSMAQKIRTSGLGQKFSKMGQIEALAKNNGDIAGATLYRLDNMLKGAEKASKNIADYSVAQHIEEYFANMSTHDELDFITSYEKGYWKDALEIKQLKNNIQKQAYANNKQAKDLLEQVKVKEKELAELEQLLKAKYDERVASVSPFEKELFQMYGKGSDALDTAELTEATSLFNKLNDTAFGIKGNGGFKSLTKYLFGESSDPALRITREKLSKAGFNAYKPFKDKFYSLPAKERSAIVNHFYNTNKNSFVESLVDLPDDDLIKMSETFGDERKTIVDMALRKRNVAESLIYTGKTAKVTPEHIKIQDEIARLGSEIAESNKHIGELTVNDITKYTNSQLMKQLKRRYDEVAKIEKLADDKQGQEMYNLVRKRMVELGEEEVKAGKLSREAFEARKDTYLRHELTDEAKKILESMPKEESGKFNPSNLGMRKHFNRQRTITTIAEGNRYWKDEGNAGQLFRTSLSEIYLIRALGSNELVNSVRNNDFIKNIVCTPYEGKQTRDKVVGSFIDINKTLTDGIMKMLKKAKEKKVDIGTFDELLDEALRYAGIEKKFFGANVAYLDMTSEQAKKLTKYTSQPIKLYNMDNGVYDMVNTFTREQQQLLRSDFANFYDTFQTHWKLWNTLVNPGFHIQNSVSNAFQSFLATGADSINPKKIKQAQDILRTGDDKQKITLAGKTYTYKDLKYIAEQYGVLDNTFFNQDLTANMHEFPIYKIGTKVGTGIEGTQRFNLFLSYLNQGATPEQAVEGVNKFLFDYGDLTKFEKETMKKILPFYTFMRKNIPMELEMMMEQPQVFSGLNKAFVNIEKMGSNEYRGENERSEWRQEHIQLPFEIGGKTFGIADQLPYNQLERVTDINKLIGQTTPILKTPLEALTGKYAYTDMEIDSPLDYLMNQTTPTKIFNNGMKKEEGTERNLYTLGQLIGFPIGEIK